MTMAKVLMETEPIVSSFTKKKDDKFNELVVLEESGQPLLTDSAKKAIDEKQINAQNGLPFGFYEYEDGGLDAILSYVEELKDEEIDISLPSISSSKKIRFKEEGKEAEMIELSEVLDYQDSKISSDALVILMETGIIK
jgi:hypothetical protein